MKRKAFETAEQPRAKSPRLSDEENNQKPRGRKNLRRPIARKGKARKGKVVAEERSNTEHSSSSPDPNHNAKKDSQLSQGSSAAQSQVSADSKAPDEQANGHNKSNGNILGGERYISDKNAVDTSHSQYTDGIPSAPAEKLLSMLVCAVETRWELLALEKHIEVLKKEPREDHTYEELRGGDQPELASLVKRVEERNTRLKQMVYRICKLAAEPGMAREPRLETLSIWFFRYIDELEEANEEKENQQSKLKKLDEEISEHMDAIDVALTRRTRILLLSPEERSQAQAIDKLEKVESYIESLRGDLKTAEQQQDAVLTEVKALDESLNMKIEFLLGEGVHGAEWPLQEAGLLKRNERVEPQDGRTSSTGGQHQSRAPRVFKAPKLEDQIKEETLQKLEEAQRAAEQAEYEFDRVRRKYHTNLHGFLKARQTGRVVGTRSQFDQAYYIDRAEANHKLAAAESHLNHIRRHCDMTHGVPEDKQSSCFADRDDDGYEDEPVIPLDILKELNEMDQERIEKWRQDERQKQISDESRWVVVDKVAYDHKSVSALSSGSEVRYAFGKQRRRIDDWQAHQADTRSRLEALSRQEQGEDKNDLFWFQEFSGI